MIEEQRLSRRDVLEELPEAGEPVIARLNRIASRLLKVRQEGKYHRFGDVRDQQIHRGFLRLIGNETKKQFQPIPVTLDRMLRGVVATNKMVLEKRTDKRRQVNGLVHGCPTSSNCEPKWVWKRAFASRRRSAVIVR